MKKRDLYYERIPTKLLREDIRLLGTFLGRVIRDQEGLAFYKIVERLRLLSKNTLLDKNKSKVFLKVSKEVKKLKPKDIFRVTRSFSHILNLMNLAESLDASLRLLQKYAEMSGLPMNLDKTKVVWKDNFLLKFLDLMIC